MLGLVLTIVATSWQVQHTDARARQALEVLGQDVARRLNDRMHIYEFGLRGLRGMLVAGGLHNGVGIAEFEAYNRTRDLAREFPGARGFGWIVRVPVASEPDFVARARQEDGATFAIRQLSPHDAERWVIRRVAPLATNREAIGLDVASERHRRDAAAAAMRTGEATLTAPITIVQASRAVSRAFLLMLPVYRGGSTPSTAAQREQAAWGWTYAPLIIDDVLSGVEPADSEFRLALRDVAVTASGPAAAPFYTTPGAAATSNTLQWQTRLRLDVYGRQWEATLYTTPRFAARLNATSPASVALAGGALSLMLGMLVNLYGRNRLRARLVEQERARHAAIVAGSSDAIVGVGLDGRITDWNAAAQRLFGPTPVEVVGRSFRVVLPPPERASDDESALEAASHGLTVGPIDCVLHHRDGQTIELSMTASPIFDHRRAVAGVAFTLRDVGAARRAEREVRQLNASLEGQVQERTMLLEAARRHLQNILDAMPVLVGYWDRSLNNRFANAAYRQWFGGAVEDLAGQPLQQVIGDRPFEAVRARIDAVLAGRSQVFDRRVEADSAAGPRHTVTHYLPDLVDDEVRGFYEVVQDVTPQLQAEERLRANEAFLERIGEVSGVGGWEYRLDEGRIVWSAQTYRIHGVDRSYVPELGDAISFYAPAARPTIQAAVEACIEDGTDWDLELPFRTATGADIWVRAVGTALRDEAGHVVQLVGTLQDITVRKHIEAELQAAQERFSIAAQAAGLGVWEWDIGANTLVWDEGMHRLYRRARMPGVLPYAVWLDAVHPNDQVRCEGALQASLRGEADYDPEFRIRWPDGTLRHIKAAARLRRDENGRPLRMVGVNLDITERKQAELDLRSTGSLLQMVLDSASTVSIIATDPDLLITVFNRGAERMLGRESVEVVGRTTPMLIHDGSEVAARAAELSLLLGRPVEERHVFTEPSTLGIPRIWTYVAHDGTRIAVSLVVTAMHGDDGQLLGYLGVAHDVSAQRRVEESLREATWRAEQASLAKGQFLANMSHEIRTPLNAVIGLTYLLAQTDLDEQQAAFLAKVRLASAALLSVVNDVLDLSKIEAGELVLERRPFELSRTLQELGDLMAVQAHGKGLQLEIEPLDVVPVWVEGDETRLRQILTNLLGNAVKFTPRGTVRLQARRTGNATAGFIRFEVEDTGIGIDAEVQDRLFAPFFQADASTTRRFGGTGLGLSIVRRLSQLMGGAVGVHSTAGKGSRFWVELPLAEVAPGTVPRTAGPTRLDGLHILVVDDSDINREVAQRIVEAAGAIVSTASDGAQALALLRGTSTVDLVLMDVQMPILDGCAATRQMRLDPTLAQLPVLALTAGGAGERARAGTGRWCGRRHRQAL
ncbi:PAS domain S-box protein [Aquabacterium sp. J223]|uniref:PAS domain S-box protein n=1 Tax=Aquabacterium sp. J223 TaxID=2898431 RepID=UPI0021AE2726|nr:PAS domain S-box protein [Aquabacterium sp. J223]UUX97882.1 PAS domain S-box protein [Aquabacterium sp. J223]